MPVVGLTVGATVSEDTSAGLNQSVTVGEQTLSGVTAGGPTTDRSNGVAGHLTQNNASNKTTDDLVVPRDGPVYVGETVALGFLAGHGGSDYEWEVVNGDDDQLLHKNTTELDRKAPNYIPHDARVTSFRPTVPGTYTIEVTVDGTETHHRHSGSGG